MMILTMIQIITMIMMRNEDGHDEYDDAYDDEYDDAYDDAYDDEYDDEDVDEKKSNMYQLLFLKGCQRYSGRSKWSLYTKVFCWHDHKRHLLAASPMIILVISPMIVVGRTTND